MVLKSSPLRAYLTVKEMLADRGYDVRDDCKEEEIPERISDGGLLMVGRMNDADKIGVFSAYPDIKGFRTLETQLTDLKLERALIVSEKPPTSYANNKLNETGMGQKFEVFLLGELQINVTKHELYMPHKRVSKEKVPRLLEKWKVKPDQLPVLRKTDPIARYFGYQKGDVIRINRKLGSLLPEKYYRIVQ